MPTKRIRRTHGRHELDPFVTEHLQSGSDHLLGDKDVCWICQRGIESARSVWEANRDEIMADWKRFGFPFPCLAQMVFEDAPFPPERDPAWRDLFKWTWTQIADELVALAPYDVRGHA